MYAYRFEHKSILGLGIEPSRTLPPINGGPYTCRPNSLMTESQFILREMSSKHSTDKYPSIYEDLEHLQINKFKDFFCACPSLEMLKKWFYGYNTFLKRNDYVIVGYELKQLTEGISGKQCFFKRKDIISRNVL